MYQLFSTLFIVLFLEIHFLICIPLLTLSNFNSNYVHTTYPNLHFPLQKLNFQKILQSSEFEFLKTIFIDFKMAKKEIEISNFLSKFLNEFWTKVFF